MFNALAKSLVLMQALLSVAGMTWAMMLVVQSRDLGRAEPANEVLETNADGTPAAKPGAVMRFASEYDKSVVAVQEAAKARDRVYRHVKPALDSIVATEKFMPENHLFYLAQLKRLREERSEQDKKDDKPFKVFRLKNGGTALPIEDGNLGKPDFEANEVAMIKKPFKEYEADYKGLVKEIDVYEGKLQKVAILTQNITAETTGTNKSNEYVNPGLYELKSMEFKYQGQIKVEIDAIKQDRSEAIGSSGTLRLRRSGLEATLKKLQEPVLPRDNKKL
jgi:hypothetical protein